MSLTETSDRNTEQPETLNSGSSSIEKNQEILPELSSKDSTKEEETTLPTANKFIGATDIWDDVEIYDGRITKILENTVHVECLVDKEKEIIETNEYYRLLLENINLELGAYVNIRVFFKKGKSTIVFKDGSKLVNREPFERIPEIEYDDIEPVNITKL